jgi:hypothetical protein
VGGDRDGDGLPGRLRLDFGICSAAAAALLCHARVFQAEKREERRLPHWAEAADNGPRLGLYFLFTTRQQKPTAAAALVSAPPPPCSQAQKKKKKREEKGTINPWSGCLTTSWATSRRAALRHHAASARIGATSSTPDACCAPTSSLSA